jgi:hypothetical protein
MNIEVEEHYQEQKTLHDSLPIYHEGLSIALRASAAAVIVCALWPLLK